MKHKRSWEITHKGIMKHKMLGEIIPKDTLKHTGIKKITKYSIMKYKRSKFSKIIKCSGMLYIILLRKQIWSTGKIICTTMLCVSLPYKCKQIPCIVLVQNPCISVLFLCHCSFINLVKFWKCKWFRPIYLPKWKILPKSLVFHGTSTKQNNKQTISQSQTYIISTDNKKR